MEIVKSVLGFGYTCAMRGHNEPEFYPHEEQYIKVENITLIDQAIKKKAQKGYLVLTTHRILWYRDAEGLHIPLHNVKDFKPDKHLFGSEYILLRTHNTGTHSPYVRDLHQNHLKLPLPDLPRVNNDTELKFKEKGMRDKFDKLLRDALKLQIWIQPIPVKVNPALGGGAGIMGGQLPSTSIGGITYHTY